jgi:hypothetical protein
MDRMSWQERSCGDIYSLEITGVLIVFLFWWVLDNRRYRILADRNDPTILLAVSFFILPDWFIHI